MDGPSEAAATPSSRQAAAGQRVVIYRHRLPVRVMHWINVLCMAILLMSGLGIFNAHPALYWGKDSGFASPWLAIKAEQKPGGALAGKTQIGDRQWETTGVLGLSKVDGEATSRAFPSWATVPGPQWLSMSRRWHFFFAWLFVINGIAYVLYTIFSRHLTRDLVPTLAELRAIGASIKDHLLLKHPSGEAARRYNVLQNLSYLIVVFGLLPLVVLAGLAMSPRIDTVFTGWVDWLGGRQSARSLHFLAAGGLLLFTLIHVFEVIINGVWNEIRSMLTGWYRLPPEPKTDRRQQVSR
ncbi:MAG TPA: cytochrome b/b6 domain-containing protein [Methylibium sp.]